MRNNLSHFFKKLERSYRFWINFRFFFISRAAKPTGGGWDNLFRVARPRRVKSSEKRKKPRGTAEARTAEPRRESGGDFARAFFSGFASVEDRSKRRRANVRRSVFAAVLPCVVQRRERKRIGGGRKKQRLKKQTERPFSEVLFWCIMMQCNERRKINRDGREKKMRTTTDSFLLVFFAQTHRS